jgi:nitrous oxidase accessory protein NosD
MPLLIAILLVMGTVLADTAWAVTVLVPDDFPTVTSAIASGADTIRIREGIYPERPVVDHPVALQGIGEGRRPRLDGLEINHTRFGVADRWFSIGGIEFSGRVIHRQLYGNRNVRARVTECALDSGFVQIGYAEMNALSSLTFRNCRFGMNSNARAAGIFMQADTVSGSVSWNSEDIEIRDCWFTGGAGVAIGVWSLHGIRVANNRIEGYSGGISLETENGGVLVDGNTIRQCRGTAIDIRRTGDAVDIRNNEITDCGMGIYGASAAVYVSDNTILRAAGAGVWVYPGDAFVAERNVVGDCTGAGFHVEWDPWSYYGGRLRSNTIFHCGGSGMELIRSLGYSSGTIAVENNIGYNCGGWGLAVAGGPVQHGCNDWFGNRSGAVSGAAPDTTDLDVDPLFCDVEGADVRLDAASPLAGAPGCGPIGALGVGCGARLEMVTVEPEDRGALVRWRFGLFAPALTWLERKGEAAGSWERLVGEPTKDGQAYRVVDEGVEPGLGYWYRIGWLDSEGLETGYSSPVSYRSPSVSRLFPNPSAGPVSIEWTLESAADVEVRVFDLAGRRVATLASGRFEPGRGSARWDGLQSNGTPAPAGWYVVRVRGGTIDSAHRLLLLR